MSARRPAAVRPGSAAPKLLWAMLALVLATAVAPRVRAADLAYPPLTGRVTDAAHVLTLQVQADLTTKLADLERTTGRQLVVATVPSLQDRDVQDYGVGLLRAWGIGSKAKNDGAILLVAPTERKVGIEVGYGLEGDVTDAFSALLIQHEILPKFRAGDLSGGVSDGADALIAQLQLPPDEARARLADAQTRQAAEAARAAPARRGGGSGAAVVFGLLLIFWAMSAFSRRGGRGGRGGGGLGWLLPMVLLNGLGSRRDDDDWGGGGFGGGGFGGGGGGGFSGGGGSGGGGGASGSW